MMRAAFSPSNLGHLPVHKDQLKRVARIGRGQFCNAFRAEAATATSKNIVSSISLKISRECCCRPRQARASREDRPRQMTQIGQSVPDDRSVR